MIPRVVGVLAACTVVLGVVAASRATLPLHREPHAMVRLAWTGRPERIEHCRTLPAEELAKLPAHMRQHVVCEGTTARYEVTVQLEDRLLHRDTIRGGGLRHDRQLYYFRELRVPPGRAVLDVTVARLDSTPAAPLARTDSASHDAGAVSGMRREMDERRRRIADQIPPRLAMRDTVVLAPREVMLVVFDRAVRRFRTIRRAPTDTLIAP